MDLREWLKRKEDPVMLETVSWAEYRREGQNMAAVPGARAEISGREGRGRAQGWQGRPATESSERKKKGNELRA